MEGATHSLDGCQICVLGKWSIGGSSIICELQNCQAGFIATLPGAETDFDGCTKCEFLLTSDGGNATACEMDYILIGVLAAAGVIIILVISILIV